jgi:prepilin-type N-terminal cleavage/methylation domain-containing protein
MSAKAGFSLIEALVALAIGAGVLVIAAQGLSLGVASLQRAESRQAASDAVLAAHAVVRSKAARMVAAPNAPVEGGNDYLSFTAAERGETAAPGLYRLTFRAEPEGDGWALWLSRTPVTGGAEQREAIWRGADQPEFAFDDAAQFTGAAPPRKITLALGGPTWPELTITPAGGRAQTAPPIPDTTTAPLRDPTTEVPQ